MIQVAQFPVSCSNNRISLCQPYKQTRYRKTSIKCRVQNKRRVSNKRRGSEARVLTNAGPQINAGVF